MESAAFILHEAQARADDSLIAPALKMIGLLDATRLGMPNMAGLLYFVDVDGKPPTQLEWDMKLWWPHSEGALCLVAWLGMSAAMPNTPTGSRRCTDYTFAHFPDDEYGGWYGYLRRDGSLSTSLKGGMWKGFFHTPRALWLCWRLLGQMTG